MKHTISLAAVAFLLAGCEAAPSRSVYQSVPFKIGGTLFRHEDQITVKELLSTTGKIEASAVLKVRGTYSLQSEPEARLYFGLTTSEEPQATAVPTAASPKVESSRLVAQGSDEFELTYFVEQTGFPHVTFYGSESGRPFGGLYFGSDANLMTDIPEYYRR
ncbi:MAG: hypothetical protein H6830_06610 [Planctomycetes bacterium]|nr:hypothetical protein [Planctomycetota bacterium]MCB9910977.1 hypothetical protein [Planctomycetota bacterium]MCB9911556.1 hypothetical protein [Planctomycetota bacterium]HPF13578.1 hypothetical protein [Planctomycetota bacterium]HRV80651.1 hypothetical protein [Planctomycetota bacterium]